MDFFRSNLFLFLSIFLSILIIYFSVLNLKGKNELILEKGQVTPFSINNNSDINNIIPYNSSDYIMGNPNAPVKVIEFSDTECAFCKLFHPVMTKVMLGDLGKSGKVAWIYRHFPVEALHSKARIEAEAVECAGELGGNNAFWDYLDRLFQITPSNNDLDLDELPNIAEFIGLDKEEFEKCLNEMKYQDKINAQKQDGINSGVLGTPYSIVIDSEGNKYPIPGFFPYERVEKTLRAIVEGSYPK